MKIKLISILSPDFENGARGVDISTNPNRLVGVTKQEVINAMEDTSFPTTGGNFKDNYSGEGKYSHIHTNLPNTPNNRLQVKDKK